MSKSASAQIKMSATVSYSYTDAFGISYSGSPTISQTETLSSTDITKVYSTKTTSASPVTLDLTNCTDVFGATLTFASLKGLYVENTSTNQDLTIGGGSAPALGGDQYTVGPGQVLFITTDFTIDGSAKNIIVTPAASLTYELIAVGA